MRRGPPFIKGVSQVSDAKTQRRPRADAVRNRERLIDAAKAAFAEIGPEVSLEEIARRAEVGIGTLYRHFPTRDAVVEAVYRREVVQLAEAAETLLATHRPVEALTRWLHLAVDYLATKRLIAPALGALPGGTAALYESSGVLLEGAMTRLAEAAVAAGEIRADVQPMDLMRAVAGLSYNTAAPGWRESTMRLIDVLLAGLRAV